MTQNSSDLVSVFGGNGHSGFAAEAVRPEIFTYNAPPAAIFFNALKRICVLAARRPYLYAQTYARNRNMRRRPYARNSKTGILRIYNLCKIPPKRLLQ